MQIWSRAVRVMMVAGAWLPAACVATKLPLCPKVARLSYPQEAPRADVNRFVIDRARERRVRVTPLSTFTAEFSGYVRDVRWLELHYSSLLCAFESSQVIDTSTLYRACTRDAPSWIAAVQSAHPEHLMRDETFFKETCALPTAQEAAKATLELDQETNTKETRPCAADIQC